MANSESPSATPVAACPATTNGTTPAATNNTNKKDGTSPASTTKKSSVTASPRHCAPKMDTKDRLFGSTPEPPRKAVKNNATFKSNIFTQEMPPSSPAKTSKKQIAIIERNPITGEVKIPPRVTV